MKLTPTAIALALTLAVGLAPAEAAKDNGKSNGKSNGTALGQSESIYDAATGNTYNRVQSNRPGNKNKNPYGLSIVDRVQTRGSDAKSQQFQATLPSLESYVRSNLQERVNYAGATAHQIDPGNLKLTTDAEVRTYFVSEGAGYHNMLGFNVDGIGIDGDSRLIFPDASVPNAFLKGNENAKRTKNFPVLPGDFVELGTFSSGEKLDFFLVADDKKNNHPVYDSNPMTNPDGINHMVAFSYAVADSPYLMIGFEDLFKGGDQDFNDLVFVVDIGESNVNALVAAPEPGTMAAFAAAGAIYYHRRRKATGTEPSIEPVTA